MTDWRLLTEPWERLRWARLRAGFDRAKDAADSMGMKPITYRTYEREPGRAGHRAFSHQQAAQFARKFKVSWTWLLTGDGEPDVHGQTAPQIEAGRIAERLDGMDAASRDMASELIWSVLDAYAKRA